MATNKIVIEMNAETIEAVQELTEALIHFSNSVYSARVAMDGYLDALKTIKIAASQPPRAPVEPSRDFLSRCACDLADSPDAPLDWHGENCPLYQPGE